MGRRISYRWDVLQVAGVGKARAAGSADDLAVRGDSENVSPAENYGDRLLQYIPAEVLAFFIAASSLADSDGKWWAILAVGCVGVICTMPKFDQMTFWTIPLCVIAFLAWAFGTTQADEELFGMDEGWSALILCFAVFLVPLVDRALASRFRAAR